MAFILSEYDDIWPVRMSPNSHHAASARSARSVQGMHDETTPPVHEIEVESDVLEDRHVVRCSCGWEQATSGWMLESSQDEVRRLVAAHLAQAST